MNKNLIIESLYFDKSYFRACQVIATPNYCEDLFHEVILIFLEMDEIKVINAYEQGFLKFLFIRIATNNYKSSTSPFYKKYRQNDVTETLNINHQIGEHGLDEEYEKKYLKLIVRIENQITNLDEYERELLKLYVRFNDYRKVSVEVGIKYESVRHAIIKALNKIKSKNEKLYNDMCNEQFDGLHYIRDAYNILPKDIEEIPD